MSVINTTVFVGHAYQPHPHVHEIYFAQHYLGKGRQQAVLQYATITV